MIGLCGGASIIRMTKSDIHRLVVERFTEELAAITAAAKSSFEAATNKEHNAESRFDTFSLESSFLARGQAKRVSELSDALEQLQLLPLAELTETSLICLGALVRLTESNGDKRTLLLCPAGGGEAVVVADETITIMTPRSPLGRAVLGKTQGDTVTVEIGGAMQTLHVDSVE